MVNQFLHLRRPGNIRDEITGEAKVTVLYSTSKESATIMVYQVNGSDKRVYGYSVTLLDGRNVSALPSAPAGHFDSEREAKLHFLGALATRPDLISEEAMTQVNNQIFSLVQTELF